MTRSFRRKVVITRTMKFPKDAMVPYGQNGIASFRFTLLKLVFIQIVVQAESITPFRPLQ